MLERGDSVGLTSSIFQEVVQGVSSARMFDRVSECLGLQTVYHPYHPIEGHQEAACLHFDCRRTGVSIRSAIDRLIARVAIEHGLVLLHDGRDFEKIAGVVPELPLA